MPDLDFRTSNPELQRTLDELRAAGWSATYWSLSGGGGSPGGDLPRPEFCVRIERAGVQFDGLAGHEDDAFVETVSRLRAASTER